MTATTNPTPATARTAQLGRRIELVPMDGHFHDITVALYRRADDDGTPTFRVHTYSGRDGAGARIARIRAALQALAGLRPAADDHLAFACGDDHDLAVRRAFLEACKLDPDAELTAAPLETTDRKSGLTLAAVDLGDGQYRVEARGDDPDGVAARRVGVIVNGLLKLGDMRRVETGGQVADDVVAFACGCAHDALVGLLLQRAPNVRALVREQEAMAARGVLSAPGAQETN